ncbi:porin [Paraferrimonas sedimenticola]|uniref:Porin n=1 Tax=Paraferrimonas sedimenticola TaxID=375674 RepID=A0AA37RY10_9GAMM|nr:porin [Paraferrimonas sedimenticola]GLP97293.1 porin [Paraferrimonas sedimenticola]
MKKSLLSASVASLLAASSFAAMAEGPTVYGRLDVSVTNSNNGIASMRSEDRGVGGTVLENNASMIGIKGAHNVAKDLDVIYKVEVGANGMTSNASSPFSSRATWIGVQSVAGSAIIGREDSVFKQSEGKIDAFGNGNSDIDRLLPGQGREADVVNYYSPRIANLVTVNGSYVLNDGNAKYADRAYALNATIGDKGFKEQKFYVAGAMVDGLEDIKAVRGVAQGKVADLTLGLLYQNSESAMPGVDRKGQTYVASATYAIGDWLLKAQYGQDNSGLGNFAKFAFVDQNKNNDQREQFLKDMKDFDLKQFSVGAHYNLSSNAFLYGQYTQFDGSTTLVDNKINLDDKLVTVGIRYTF